MQPDGTAGSVRIGDPSLAASALGWSAKTKMYEGLKQVYLWMKNSDQI